MRHATRAMYMYVQTTDTHRSRQIQTTATEKPFGVRRRECRSTTTHFFCTIIDTRINMSHFNFIITRSCQPQPRH